MPDKFGNPDADSPGTDSPAEEAAETPDVQTAEDAVTAAQAALDAAQAKLTAAQAAQVAPPPAPAAPVPAPTPVHAQVPLSAVITLPDGSVHTLVEQ